MKKVLSILSYISQALLAVTKGFEVTAEHWPKDNPFTSSDPISSDRGNEHNPIL
jgi:hypothetical protein